jgi:hypothetical protein
MTNMDERHDHGHMDDNLDRLIKLGEPSPRMPENLKARIRTRLAEVGQVSEKKNFILSRWAIVSPLAAAAALALFLVFFWPGSTPSTISWADVQKKLEQIHTMSARSYKEITTTEGKRIIKRSKIYIKDPGLLKIEYYPPDADIEAITPGPDRIHINKLDTSLSELLILSPDSHRAELVTQIFRNSGTEPLPGPKDVNLALENWKWMKQIAADKTNCIGDRVIHGVPAVGFEFYTFLEDFYIPSDKPVRPDHVQIWVSRDDAVPLLTEVEFQNTQGQKVRIVCSDIQWNLPLKESLFDLTVPKDWSISRSRIELALNTRLAPGVTLQIGPEGQNPLIVAWDVVMVSWASQTTHVDSNIPSEMRITIELKPETAMHLHDYANTHPDQLIVVNFNGQLKVAAELEMTHFTQVSFDLSLLGISLAELEEQYLRTTIERNK